MRTLLASATVIIAVLLARPSYAYTPVAPQPTMPPDVTPVETAADYLDPFVIYEVTAYTNDYKSTGKRPGDRSYGITASGTRTVEGTTLACPRSMPLGSTVYIPYFDRTFTCLDRGGRITDGKLDVYVRSETEAERFGRRKLPVQITINE